METKKKTVEELHEALACFTGTFAYHTHKTGDLKLLLIDGCDYLRREAEAYWLFDSILAHHYNEDVNQYQQIDLFDATFFELLIWWAIPEGYFFVIPLRFFDCSF